MKLDELESRVKKYQKASSSDFHYNKIISSSYLVDPSLITVENVRNDIIRFLNIWRCRIPYSSVLIKSLHRTALEESNLLKIFRKKNIEDVRLIENIKINGEVLSISKAVHYIFDKFCYSGHRFTGVAASKTLHLFAPGFFVMWDNYIAAKYECDLDGYSYAYSFLPKIKQELKELTDDVMKTRDVKQYDLACNIIRTAGGVNRTIAKVIDEYNYIKFSNK